MKNRIILLIILLIMSGCTNSQKPEAKPKEAKSEERIESKPIELKDVLELGSLDAIPLNFQDEGWIIQQDGKYGFVNNKGEMVIEPEYENATLTMHSDTDEQIDMAYLFHDEIDPAKDALLPYDHVPDPGLGYGVGAPVITDGAFLAEDNKIVYYNLFEKQEVSSLTVPIKSIATVYPVGTNRETKDTSDYMILNPFTKSITDPLPAGTMISGEQMLMDWVQHWNTPIGWLFWLPEDDKAALVNAKKDEMISGFDSAAAVDLKTVLGRKDDQCFVYDQNLDLVYMGKFDNGAAPLDGLVPVEMNGQWSIVKLEDVKKTFSEQKSPFEKENLTLFHEVEMDSSTEKKKESQAIKSSPVLTTGPGRYTVQVVLNVRSGPSKSYSVVGQKDVNENIQVTETTLADDGSEWGKIGDGSWVCLKEGSQEYCRLVNSNIVSDAPTSNDTLSVEQIGQLIVSHYTDLMHPDGYFWVEEPLVQGNTATYCLRYVASAEPADGMVTANELVAIVTADMNTGKVIDNQNLDTWSFK
ncbi:WG repeat-containing protein [Faecalibaculum rodentium]|jgi:hypothetical protein|uniref:WG repeat-containing protein n=1 Tax=Faecalibaculum rodentium TaxID=1702221 RepID=UPI002570975E|nr:WG repeat-containing protein [Faecalibaculum rodentium]